MTAKCCHPTQKKTLFRIRMKYFLIHIVLAIAILIGCKNEKLPNKDELFNILSLRNFKLTIKYCHGGMAGSVGCWDEIMIFKNDTLIYEVDDKTYIRLLDWIFR
jgi:hypothetical protein